MYKTTVYTLVNTPKSAYIRKKRHYSAVHGHMTSLMSLFPTCMIGEKGRLLYRNEESVAVELKTGQRLLTIHVNIPALCRPLHRLTTSRY